jgi:hypothetical protein
MRPRGTAGQITNHKGFREPKLPILIRNHFERNKTNVGF